MGYSQRKIGSSVKCSKSTVGEIQSRCREIGLSYNQAVELTDREIKALVYPVYSGRRIIKPDPDFDYYTHTPICWSQKIITLSPIICSFYY